MYMTEINHAFIINKTLNVNVYLSQALKIDLKSRYAILQRYYHLAVIDITHQDITLCLS